MVIKEDIPWPIHTDCSLQMKKSNAQLHMDEHGHNSPEFDDKFRRYYGVEREL